MSARTLLDTAEAVIREQARTAEAHAALDEVLLPARVESVRAADRLEHVAAAGGEVA